MTESHKSSLDVSAEIQQWMESDADSPREFIVQVELPHPQIEVRTVRGRPRFDRPISDSNDDRDERLQRTLKEIQNLNPLDSRVLRAAGAIVVRVLPQQLKEIASLPGIRAVFPNRKLPGRKDRGNDQ